MAQVPVSGASNRAWQWLLDGWQTLRDKAAQAITYFAPEEDEAPSQRWGVLATDVVEKTDSVEVELELPGMAKSDLEVEVVNDHLIVSGTKRSSSTRSEGALVITERAFGQFKRVVPLPCPVDSNGTRAIYKEGILTVSLPKHPSLVARSIPVTSG